jgi:hypothetical protein
VGTRDWGGTGARIQERISASSFVASLRFRKQKPFWYILPSSRMLQPDCISTAPNHESMTMKITVVLAVQCETWTTTYFLSYYGAQCKQVLAVCTNSVLVSGESTYRTSEDGQGCGVKAQPFSTSATLRKLAVASKTLQSGHG